MKFAGVVLAVLLAHAAAQGQKAMDEIAPALSPVASLGLTPEKVSHLNQAVAEHEYGAAEKLRLDELASQPAPVCLKDEQKCAIRLALLRRRMALFLFRA